jgi:hypothetical protein
MKKICFIVVAILLLENVSFAQVDPVGQFNRHIVENWKDEYIRIGQYKVRGTPYLFGESFPGTLTFKGGSKSNTNILYDLYNQKAGADVKNNILESGLELDEFTIMLPAKFGGNTLLFKSTAAFGNASLKNYFNVLEDGARLSFLKLFRIKLLSDPSNMMDKEQKIFEQYYEYYLYNKASKELTKIKLREKDFNKQLGDDLFVKDFIAKGNLDVSLEINAVKLVQEYNKQ